MKFHRYHTDGNYIIFDILGITLMDITLHEYLNLFSCEGSANICLEVLIYVCLSVHPSIHVQVEILACIKVPEASRSIQKHPEASRSIQKHPEAFKSIQKHSEAFKKHPEAFRSIQKHPESP